MEVPKKDQDSQATSKAEPQIPSQPKTTEGVDDITDERLATIIKAILRAEAAPSGSPPEILFITEDELRHLNRIMEASNNVPKN